MMNGAQKELGVPALRFPDFKDDAEGRKLTDLCHRIGDGIHSTPIYSENGDYHFINGNNLNDGTIKIEPTTKMVDLEEAKKHYRKLSDDTILLSINGTIGNMAFYRHEKVILGKSACYINVDDSAASKRYIYSFLGTERVRYYFESELTGSTIKNLSLSAIRNLHLFLPSLPEQKKIAEFLTAVDERIQQLNQKKALLEAYKKGVMQQLFSQELRFKDDEGNEFPDWEEKRLGEVCKIKTGKKDVNEGNPNGQYPFFTCARQHTFSDNYSFDTTAILIAGNGEVGHCQLYKGKFEAYQRTYVLSEFTRSVEYIFPYLNFFFRRTVDQQKQMGAMPYIKLGMLTDFLIPIPSDPVEQTKIAVLVAAIDRKIESVGNQITETQSFKKGLLQQMFV
jgi:type I restriction enzyme, S subunit